MKNFSKENNISKRQARKTIFWQTVEPSKMRSTNFSKRRKVFKEKSKSQIFEEKSASFSNKNSKVSNGIKSTIPRIFFQKKVGNQTSKFQNKTSYHESYLSKPKVDYVPNSAKCYNPLKKQADKVSYAKGITTKRNIDHWLEGKGKIYQSSKFSKEQIHEAYDKYANPSTNGSLSSKESNISVKVWQPVTRAKREKSQTQDAKGEISENLNKIKTHISDPSNENVRFIDSFKTKVYDWVNGCTLQLNHKPNLNGPNKAWVPKFFQ